MPEATAKLRYLRIAPRKARLVADLIRGANIKEAKMQLAGNLKKTASPILKLLNSAESNAKHNFKLNSENLYVKEIRVDQGPFYKRYMPRARGRATVIKRKTSHISLVLAERVVKVKPKKQEEKSKKEKTKKEK